LLAKSPIVIPNISREINPYLTSLFEYGFMRVALIFNVHHGGILMATFPLNDAPLIQYILKGFTTLTNDLEEWHGSSELDEATYEEIRQKVHKKLGTTAPLSPSAPLPILQTEPSEIGLSLIHI
jgi:hypothetical protein